MNTQSTLHRIVISTMCLLAIHTASAAGDKAVKFHLSTGETMSSTLTAIDSLTFNAAADTLIVVRGGISRGIAVSTLDSISYGTQNSTIDVRYDGAMATVENPYAFDGVSISITGAEVCVTASPASELEYKLSGTSDNGCFKIYSSLKYQITLNGLSLTHADGPAINSQSKKKGTIKVQGGTVNHLCDGTKYTAYNSEDQKGTIFSEGQLIFKGAGSLYVTGLCKHGICSDDYVEIDNGVIQVLAAASDAIHANDSVLVYGGKVSLAATGDGIDCAGWIRVAAAATDSLTIVCDGDDTSAIKSDSLTQVKSGNLCITTTGAACKGIKSKGDVNIGGGVIKITQSGDKIITDGDPSYTTAIKADRDIIISGGSIVIDNSADGGKGLSADGNISVSEGTVTVTCNGAGGTYDPTSSESGGGSETETHSYKVYVNLPATASQGGGGGFGGQTQSNPWTSVYLYKNDGTKVATLTGSVTVTGTTGASLVFYYYDFKAADTGTYYFASDTYQAQGNRPGSSTSSYAIQTGTFSGPNSGEDVYYSISSTYSTSGTTRTYSLSDVTTTYANGTQSSASADGEGYAASCLKADGNISIDGGILTLKHTGAMSKGINCDGLFTLNDGTIGITAAGATQIVNRDPSYCTGIKAGSYAGHGGTVTIEATGTAGRGLSIDGDMTADGGTYTLTCSGAGNTYTNTANQSDGYGACGIKVDNHLTMTAGSYDITCTGKGGKGMKIDGNATFGTTTGSAPTLSIKTSGTAIATSGSGMNASFIGAAKAMRVAGDIVINDGNISATTSTDGGEGIESKASITINGGYTECSTYDDGINAATKITVNGGFVYSHATGNDGIDCNGSQGFEFNGGVIMASGTNSPEEGFDCDNYSFKINGGLLIGTGGSTSTPTSASQPYVQKSSIAVSAGKYLSVKKSDGTVLFSYKCPNTVNSATVVLSSPDFIKGTSYTLVYGATAVSNPTESAFGGVFSRGGTLTGGSTTTITPTTK